MGRKGNQQKNGLDQRSQTHKKGVSDHGPSPSATENGGNLNDETDHIQEGKNGKKKNRKPQKKERKIVDEMTRSPAVPCPDNAEVDANSITTDEVSNMGNGINSVHVSNLGSTNSSDDLTNNVPYTEEGLAFPETVVFKFIRTAVMSVARLSAEWVERHKPTFVNLKSNTLKARDHVRIKIQKAQPIIFRWIMHIGNVMLLLFMVWLECTLRGIDSFLRMGTTSFFSIIWCSILSVIAMVGITKFLIAAVIAAAVGLFLGFTLAILLTGIIGIIFLWFYGSFWTTGLTIVLGGLAFLTSHDRIALFILSAYSVYCAWNYVGWFGLLVGLNLSFISSDALLFFLRNTINEQRMPDGSQDQAAGQTSFSPNEGSPIDGGPSGPRADRGPGVPSTSGSDSETTSEDEVVRLLNCTDHYAALGMARFENIDVSVIKKEYRKKAMLVHPDKNMGNEKAAEAFKKLQNAYEVLLDSFKRKEYDDELRREELLNYFRKFQNASQENRGHGLFRSGFAHSEGDGDESLLAESRRIACRKCGFFHLWAYTKKPKSRARWCQECKDFHPAKDGDGWVEQSSRPFLFGLLQQVEAPSAYVCADGKVYDVSEWYICQGMRCPVNTHKPSFHVNTSVVSKSGPTKGTGPGQRATPNMEETMTEEEFYEWLQNAVQNGVFENFPGASSENPKGSSSSSAGGKRRKKGKK